MLGFLKNISIDKILKSDKMREMIVSFVEKKIIEKMRGFQLLYIKSTSGKIVSVLAELDEQKNVKNPCKIDIESFFDFGGGGGIDWIGIIKKSFPGISAGDVDGSSLELTVENDTVFVVYWDGQDVIKSGELKSVLSDLIKDNVSDISKQAVLMSEANEN